MLKNVFKSFLFVLSLSLLQSGNVLGYMSGKVVNLNSGTNILANSDFIGKEKIIMKCGETFSGNGLLQAPVITITAKKFAFTGTIKCDVSCTITVKEKFNPKMFRRKGKGKFIINVDPDLFTSPAPAAEPRTINVCGVDFTLKHQASLDVVDAIENNDVNKLIEIIEATPDLKKCKNTLAILMLIAGHYNCIDAVKELISLGADVNSDNINSSGERPLLFALVLKNADFVRVLVQAGADPNKGEGRTFSLSTTPLIMRAVCDSDVSCLIELLKAENIDIDKVKDWKNGRTALMAAAYYGYKDKVRILLEAGADPSLKDGYGWDSATAVDYASSQGHQDIVKLIKNFKKKDETKKDSESTTSKKDSTNNATDKKKVDEEKVAENKTSEQTPSSTKNVETEEIVSESETSKKRPSSEENVPNEEVKQKRSWISNIKFEHCLNAAVPILICACIVYFRFFHE